MAARALLLGNYWKRSANRAEIRMAASGPPHGISWRDATIFGGPNLRLPGWLTAVAGHLVLIAEDSEDTRADFMAKSSPGRNADADFRGVVPRNSVSRTRRCHPYFRPYLLIASSNSPVIDTRSTS